MACLAYRSCAETNGTLLVLALIQQEIQWKPTFLTQATISDARVKVCAKATFRVGGLLVLTGAISKEARGCHSINTELQDARDIDMKREEVDMCVD